MYKIISNFVMIFLLTYCLSLSAHGDDGSQATNNSPTDLSLPGLLKNALQTHEDLKSVESQVEKARALQRKTMGLNYPTLDFRADGGRERIDKEFGTETTMNRYDA
ncbi:MAG: hypothetical protein LC657_17060, partial [Desulfobacteraceae bacterium]|nr:hypothetical protein [Desulfobacteraceae bacterium]